MPHSSRGLGHRPLKAEITGSNPVCGTNSAFFGPIHARIGLFRARRAAVWSLSGPDGPVSPVEALGVWPASNYRLDAFPSIDDDRYLSLVFKQGLATTGVGLAMVAADNPFAWPVSLKVPTPLGSRVAV